MADENTYGHISEEVISTIDPSGTLHINSERHLLAMVKISEWNFKY